MLIYEVVVTERDNIDIAGVQFGLDKGTIDPLCSGDAKFSQAVSQSQESARNSCPGSGVRKTFVEPGDEGYFAALTHPVSHPPVEMVRPRLKCGQGFLFYRCLSRL